VFATVRNFGTAPLNDRVTISLYASSDGAIDDADAPLTSVTKPLKLQPFATSKRIAVKIAAPFGSADGSYHVLARTTSATTAPGAAAASPSALTVAAPFRDLAVSFASPPPATVKANRPFVLRMLVRNDGNDTATGTLERFFSFRIPQIPIFLNALGPDPRINLKPAASKIVKLRADYRDAAAGTLTVFLTPSASVGDTNPDNNAAEPVTLTVQA
jgi:hypothetical protein